MSCHGTSIMKRYELLIGRRYLRSNRGNRYVSLISVISMVGVAIGVAVLIVVLSVMNGFESELRGRILSMTAHASISALGAGINNWEVLEESSLRNPQIKAAAPYIEDQALLIAGGLTSGASLIGVLPAEQRKLVDIESKMREGSLDRLASRRYGIVLGTELAKELGVKLDDRVIVVTSQPVTTPVGVRPLMKSFKVVGIFASGMYEFDRTLAYVHMEDAARLYRMGNEVTGLRLRLDDMFKAPSVVRELAVSLGGGYYVADWTSKHANFFRSIQLAKSILYLMLLLVVAVAAFNIIATLVMVVKDKQSDIAILRTLGASPRSVLSIFITQGTLIGLIGTLSGVALGVLLAVNLQTLVHWLEQLLGISFLDAKVYFMSDLPGQVQWDDVVKISLTTFALCCLSTLYPAWRAARTQPAQALRHE
jgi:lipoprotein-releasing system permease protein